MTGCSTGKPPRPRCSSAYGRFSPKLVEVAQPFFNSGWIDAPVRDGKSPGAFAHPTVPSAHPYLMLNYLGKARDVMTLAHELGHGVHQRAGRRRRGVDGADAADTGRNRERFGEMLTFRSLLEAATTRQQRFALLSSKVEDMLNTVVRQIAFYTFERDVHTARRKGELTHRGTQRYLARCQPGKPGAGDQAQRGLRHLLVVHPALHP